MFTRYWTAIARARKPHRMGLLFTDKNGDFCGNGAKLFHADVENGASPISYMFCARTAIHLDGIKYSGLRTGIYLTEPSRPTALARFLMCERLVPVLCRRYSHYTVFTAYRVHTIACSYYTVFTLYRVHSIPCSHHTTFILYRVHTIPFSHYTMFTQYRVHTLPRSHYTVFTAYRVHTIACSYYTVFTLYRVHSIPCSHHTAFILYRVYAISCSHHTVLVLCRFHTIPCWHERLSGKV